MLSSTRTFNLDTLALTVDGVSSGITYNDVWIAWSVRNQVTAPTLPSDMASFDIDNGLLHYKVGASIGFVEMTMKNLWNGNEWRRTKRNGVWQPWITSASTSSNVASATKLQTARTINGVSFDGTANIQVPAQQNTSAYTGDLNTLTTDGMYKVTSGATNYPPGSPNGMFLIVANFDNNLIQQILTTRNGLYYRYRINNSWSTWKEFAAKTDNITGNAATATQLLNGDAYMRLSSDGLTIETNKRLKSARQSGVTTMWFGWKVYWTVSNGHVTYQIQPTTDATIASGSKSTEVLPEVARPLYKLFVPLRYGGQGFAINIDGTFENDTGVAIDKGASWASASSANGQGW